MSVFVCIFVHRKNNNTCSILKLDKCLLPVFIKKQTAFQFKKTKKNNNRKYAVNKVINKYF